MADIASAIVRLGQKIICGPDPQRHLEGVQKFIDGGFDHVYIHQVGPDQEGFSAFISVRF